MRYITIILLLASIALTALACPPSSPPTHSDDDSIGVRVDTSSETVEIEPGTGAELSRNDLRALPVLFEGKLDDDGGFDVELTQVFDAEVYVGPSDEVGDPHWISRARILDEEGQTLWTQRINTHYQLLHYLTPVIEEFAPPGMDFDIEFIQQVAQQSYPQLLQFPAKIPTELEGADRYVMEFEEQRGQWTRVAEYDIAAVKQRAAPPDPELPYEIDTLHRRGSERDRINIAILGDGYTEEQRDVFDEDARAVARRMFDTSPFKEHADLFNISTVWTPSEESGAGFDCNRPDAPADCEDDFRDTAFETTFIVPALAQEYGYPADGITDRAAIPLRLAEIYELAALAAYDEVILLVNTDKRSGFARLYVAMVTNFDDRDRFLDTAVHEVGHTMGLLGDEYYNSGDACYYNEPDIPMPVNIDETANAVDEEQDLKWQEWIEEGTELPTPGYRGDEVDIGAFEPAYNCDFLVRPAKNCKMNSSTQPFCPVCAEQMVRRFYSFVGPADSTAVEVELSEDKDKVVSLTVPLREDTATDRYDVIWSVDGDVRSENTGATLSIDLDELDESETTEVSATVKNTSSFLKTRDHVVESRFDFELLASSAGS